MTVNEKIEQELDKIADLKDKLKTFEEAKFESKVTLLRGRLIRELSSFKKYLEKQENKTDKGQKLLDQINTYLSQEIFNQKVQLKERYDKEFIHGEAKVPDIVTTFPKGVSLQVRRISNDINQIKEANTTKAKYSGFADFGKNLGLLVATPVIFAGKFVIEHWYLLMIYWGLKRHNDSLAKGKEQHQEQVQEEPATEPVTEQVTEQATETAQEPAIEVVEETAPEAAQEQTPSTVQAVVEDVPDPLAENPAVAIEQPSPEEQAAARQAFEDTVARFQERSNGQVYVEGVSPTNTDLVVCRTPEDYLRAICDLCGENYNSYVDEAGNITKAGYERMLDFNIGHFWQDTRLDPIVFTDPERAYIDDFINSGALPKDALSFYDRFETVHCFDSIESFEQALMDKNPVYNDIRDHFMHCLTVSEAQDAVHCLIDLGILTAGSGVTSWLLGLDAGGMVLADAALLATAPQGGETVFELIEYIFQLMKVDPAKAVEIFGGSPIPALGF